MKAFLLVLFSLVASLPALAADSPEDVLAKVTAQCGARKCACFANNLEGFQLTFGNGTDFILKVYPELSFTPSGGPLLSPEGANRVVDTFKTTYLFDRLTPFCANAGHEENGRSDFGAIVRSEVLDMIFFAQLRKNGGSCNAFQKCDCEFSMGGDEMAPDFRSRFVINVDGTQTYAYTGGSFGGPIHREEIAPVFVENLAAMLGKPQASKERFVTAALKPLDAYRPFCRDFAPVLEGGKRQLLQLIHELEHPEENDPEGEGK